jgi:VanZ family protein
VASQANVEQALTERLPGASQEQASHDRSTTASVLVLLRKPAHLLAYAVLALLLLRALTQSAPALRDARVFLVAAWAMAAAVAAGDEIHQSFQPGREGLFSDVLVDVAGAGLGLALAVAFRRRRFSTDRLKRG